MVTVSGTPSRDHVSRGKNGKGFRYLKAGQASNYPVKIETANFRASTLCKQHSNIIYVVGFPLWVLETKEKWS